MALLGLLLLLTGFLFASYRVPIRFLSRSTNGEAIHLQSRNSDADGDALPILAAGANAFIEREVVADHGDTREHVGAVADEGGVLERRSDYAILDHVSLASGKDELAVGDIHLAAAEVYGVDAVLHAPDDVVGRIFAREHVSVGHSRHGIVLVALAAAVAGVANAHELRRKLVAEISLEDPLLDQDGVLGGVAFVVHIDRAAARGHGAVVNDRAFVAGDAFTEKAGEC